MPLRCGVRHQIGPYLLLLLTSLGHGQTVSLNLSSGSGIQGSSVALNLSLNAGSGVSPTALQWSLSYSQADVASINVTAGTALTAAGKTVSCASKTGSTTCLASGTNSN